MNPRDLSDHELYAPGEGIEEVARESGVDPSELIKLSSNENPHGPSPAAVEAGREALADAHRYPKTTHTDLTTAIADRYGVANEQVWVSPGADGALDYLSRVALEPGDRVLVPDPGFAYYPMSTRYHHGSVETYELTLADGLAQSADRVLSAYDGHRVVYVTSPHNPAGTELPPTELRKLLDAVESQTLVVVDEAYGEYTETPSAIELVDDHGDLAVTRTFSKAYGLAGLRIGYAVVPAAWGDAYGAINTPFAANRVGLVAARAALDDTEHVTRSVDSARWSRDLFHERFAVPTVESAANLVLAHVGPTADDEPGGAAVAAAARERGVIVRDTASFGLPNCVRVSCGTREESREAAETLNEAFAACDAARYDESLIGTTALVGSEVTPDGEPPGVRR